MKKTSRVLGAVLAISSAAAAQERPAETVPFELKNGLVFVQASVNGQGPFTFILDTGASVTVLKPATAQMLGLRFDEKKELSLVTLDSIKVGAAAAARVSAAVMAVPQADQPLRQLGISYDGILGYSFLSKFVVTLDYPRKTLFLAEASPSARATATLGFSYRSLTPDLAAELGLEGGLEVRAVAADGPAGAAGLKKGDVIREIQGKRVTTADDYRKILGSLHPGDKIALTVVRERKELELTVTVGGRT